MAKALPWFPLVSRIIAAVAGGYAFVWGFTSLVIALGLQQGVDYDEARKLAYLLAFLVYLAMFLWAFSAQSLLRVWLVLGGGGAAMTAAAWWLVQPTGLTH